MRHPSSNALVIEETLDGFTAEFLTTGLGRFALPSRLYHTGRQHLGWVLGVFLCVVAPLINTPGLRLLWGPWLLLVGIAVVAPLLWALLSHQMSPRQTRLTLTRTHIHIGAQQLLLSSLESITHHRRYRHHELRFDISGQPPVRLIADWTVIEAGWEGHLTDSTLEAQYRWLAAQLTQARERLGADTQPPEALTRLLGTAQSDPQS